MRIALPCALALLALFVLAFNVCLAGSPGQHDFMIDRESIEASRTDASQLAARVAAAEKNLLGRTIEPVTAKKQVAPSGDKRDYLSWAPYYWPNPDTPNRLPYIRKDGEKNPASLVDSDRPRFERFTFTVVELASLYELTGEQRFADQAVAHFRTFLLDERTGMTPHLRYSQGTPGLKDGRATGTIDFSIFPQVLDAAEMLAGSAAWTPEVDAAFRNWCAKYLEWLNTSEFGRELQIRENNIATFFEVQRVSLSLYLGRVDEARAIAEQAAKRLIDIQIEPDGSQPYELRRTLSFDYSVGNLKGLIYLARLSEPLGVDVWNYRSPRGGSLRGALDYVAKYRDPETTWPYEQIHAPRRERLDLLLRYAAEGYDEPKYRELAEQFGD